MAGEIEGAAQRDAPVNDVLLEVVAVILRFFWRRQHLLTVVQRFEQRNSRARERRRRVIGIGGPAVSLLITPVADSLSDDLGATARVAWVRARLGQRRALEAESETEAAPRRAASAE